MQTDGTRSHFVSKCLTVGSVASSVVVVGKECNLLSTVRSAVLILFFSSRVFIAEILQKNMIIFDIKKTNCGNVNGFSAVLQKLSRKVFMK